MSTSVSGAPKKLHAMHMETFGSSPMQAALDLYEGGAVDREKAEELSGAKTRQEFAQALVKRRRARRAAHAARSP